MPDEGLIPDERLPYLFAVYAVTWAVFFLYAFFVARRQHDMEREIRALRESLERTEGRGETDSQE